MPFSYTPDQANTLYSILRQRGLSDAEWPRTLEAITQTVRRAQAAQIDQIDHPAVYASPAAKQLMAVAQMVEQTRQAIDALPPSVLSALNDDLTRDLAFWIPPSEQPAVERLLTTARFPLALGMVQRAAESAAAQLTGSPSDLAPTTGLPAEVVATILASQRDHNTVLGLQVNGRPKEEEPFRKAVLGFMQIYQDATGKDITMSASGGRKKRALKASAYEEERYTGHFYQFVAAALGPARLVAQNISLGAKILAVYQADILPLFRNRG
jgi:hypothetical protein